MYKRESLILSSLLHPIKFIWRFAVMYSLMSLVFEFLGYHIHFFYRFIIGTRFEFKIFMIFVAYLTMRWVRSNVENEMYSPKSSPKSSPECRPKSTRTVEAEVEEMFAYNRRKKAEKEYEEYRRSQVRKSVMYQMDMDRASKAKYSGNEEAEDYYKRRARYWKNM